MSTAKKGFTGGFCGCLGVLAAGIVIVIVVAIIIAVAAGGGGGEKAKVVATAPGGVVQPAAAHPQVQPIGTTQKIGDAEVAVWGIRTSRGEEYSKPAAGMTWVIVDISAKNVGDDAYTLSSLLQASLLDSTNRKYSVTFGPQTVGNFDGTIPVAGTIRGEVAFEVPTGSKGLVFVFGQALGTEQAFWTVQ